MAQIAIGATAYHRILVIGGGTGGIITASLLARAGETDIAIVEPSETHYYQPLWTLVGAGVVSAKATAREEARCIPEGVKWIRDSVTEILPDNRRVLTRSGTRIRYDFLVVAVGVQLNWDAIPGLTEALRRENVSSNYDVGLAPKTWEMIRSFKGGTALFHMPGAPIKCPGAPQKIMYLAADYFRKKDIRKDAQVIYGSATAAIYGAEEYAAVLDRAVQRHQIDTRFQHDLIEIRSEKNEAVFQRKADPAGQTVTIPYDILHVAPPQSAPDFIRNSPLCDPNQPGPGWVTVDKHTMQHVRYPNIFALGDVANTPNAKTGAAAARQAPVVAANILALMRDIAPLAVYDGYIACPIVTAYGRMVLCELDYSGKPAPRLPFINTFRERYDMWLLKRYGLPWLYWNVLLKGRKPPMVNWAPPARSGAAAQEAAAPR